MVKVYTHSTTKVVWFLDPYDGSHMYKHMHSTIRVGLLVSCDLAPPFFKETCRPTSLIMLTHWAFKVRARTNSYSEPKPKFSFYGKVKVRVEVTPKGKWMALVSPGEDDSSGSNAHVCLKKVYNSAMYFVLRYIKCATFLQKCYCTLPVLLWQTQHIPRIQ